MEAPGFIFSPRILPSYCYTAKSTIGQKIGRFANLLFFSYACLGSFLNPKRNLYGVALQKIALIYTIHKVLQVTVGYLLYDSTRYCEIELEEKALAAHQALEGKGFEVERVNLFRCGTHYSATKITAPGADKHKWFLNARGINDTMEQSLEAIAERNKEEGYNTLIINGPSVGRSTGWPTPYQLGAAIEAGMQFLEENGAKLIVVDGHSWGAGMTLEGALLHDFNLAIENKIKYLFISDRTFDTFQNVANAVVERFVCKAVANCSNERLKNIAKAVIPWIANMLLMTLRFDLNCLEGAKKLNSLGIRHLIIEVDGDKDHRIPRFVSLAKGLESIKENSNRRILKSDEMTHSGPYPATVAIGRKEEIRKLTE